MSRVLVFASREDPHAGWARAKVLAAALDGRGLEVTFVDRLSSKFDDLLLVARHDVIDTPQVVIIDGRRTLMRRVGVPSAQEVLMVYGG